ncbi:hypothetical protein EDC17_10549 [Sphingobacterium alimentarium]|uniref:Tetratricopeptide repeat protein n=1 Tax=Sphingobacterium alimentarium TaxID=797292 RepID=A0A4R3VPZ6_9SPHI|nr:hypothetical protein EDC17_10549 [Sphingobacterium alimentarium]
MCACSDSRNRSYQREFLRVKTNENSRYYDVKAHALSEPYDYVTKSFNDSDCLLLFQHLSIYKLQSDGNIVPLTNHEIGNLYKNRYNFFDKDLKFFNDFYTKWKTALGMEYFQFFDDETLYELASDLCQADKIDQAIPILQLGKAHQHPYMISKLASIYAEKDLPQHYNIEEALHLYELAGELGDAGA